MTLAAYLELLDWTARQLAPGKSATPGVSPPILERLQIEPKVWCELVSGFGQLFSLVAGRAERVETYRSSRRQCRFHLPRAARNLMKT